MRILIYEHLTAVLAPDPAPGSLASEGWQMVSTVAEDLATVAGVRVVAAVHPEQADRFPKSIATAPIEAVDEPTLAALARDADAALVIAPEFEGILTRIAGWIANAGATLLGPDVATIERYSDKRATAAALGEWSPATGLWPELPEGDRLVLKPIAGAGCQWTVECPRGSVDAVVAEAHRQGVDGPWIAQPLAPGEPASVAILGRGDGATLVLPPARQRMARSPFAGEGGADGWSDVWSLHYEGGETPYRPGDAHLRERSRRLAAAVLERTSPFRGYLGVDVVFGPRHDGADDRVIEVNPRLTTSYAGYRQLFPNAIGKAMLGDGWAWAEIERMSADLRSVASFQTHVDG